MTRNTAIRLALPPLLTALACGSGAYDHPTEPLASASEVIGDVEVSVAVELHGDYVPSHLAPELRRIPARHRWALVPRLSATRAGTDLPLIWLRGEPFPGQPAEEDALRSLGGKGIFGCVGAEGAGFTLPDGTWAFIWPVGDQAYLAFDQSFGHGCQEVQELLDRGINGWGVEDGSIAVCRALDDVGEAARADRCLLSASIARAARWTNPPEVGLATPQVSVVASDDAREMARRLQADPARRAALLDGLRRGEGRTDDVLVRSALIGYFAEDQHVEIIDAAAADCGAPDGRCDPSLLRLAADALRPDGFSAPPAENCRAGLALAEAAAARGGPAGAEGAFSVLRALTRCDDVEALRPAMRRALQDPAGLVSQAPMPRFYDTVDPDCRPMPDGSGQVVTPTLCETPARLAGAWLGAHCDDESVQIAAAYAAGAPRAPYDPTEDPRLDGALRVLSRCDVDQFEASVGHLPAEVPYDEGIRSVNRLRAAYGLGP